MFEKIEITKAGNGFILHINRGVPHVGMEPSPLVFTSERALLKELRSLLKNDGMIIEIGDFKGSSKSK